MRLIRFRFGKAMGLSGAGPSPTHTQQEPTSRLSVLLQSSSCCWGQIGALLRISGAPVFPIPGGCSHSAAG